MSTEKNTIKNWFKTGLKPTQAQFWATWDSFWHKDEKLPISSIENLGNMIDGKAEANHSHAEYATNSATSLTPENVTQWQNKLGVADLKFDDQAITTTQDYAEFWLDSGATINAFNNAVYSEVLKKLNAPIENNTSDYVLLADGSTAPQTDFGKVDKVMGIAPDVDKNVDISGVAMNWTNANQRFSAIPSRHNNTTYNRLAGFDSTGNFAEVGLPALTNEMSKSTDAQKDAWRSANLKTGETFSTNQARVDYVLPTIIDIRNDYKLNVTLLGLNLYKNSESTRLSIYRHTDENGQIITPVYEDVGGFEVSMTNPKILSFSKNFYNYPKGNYRVIIHDQLLGDSESGDIKITDDIAGLPEPQLSYTKAITPDQSDESGIISLSNASIYLSKRPASGVGYGATVTTNEFLISKEEINKGFIVMFDITMRADFMSRESLISFLDKDPDTNLFQVLYTNNNLVFSNGSVHNNVGSVNAEEKILSDRMYLIVKGNVIKIMFVNLGIVETKIIDVINGLRIRGRIQGSNAQTSSLKLDFIRKYEI